MQGGARWQRCEQAFRALGQLLDLAAIDRLDDRAARRKVTVQRADADAGAAGDLIQADVRARFGESEFGDFQ